jgi:hypothetical protein
MWKINYQTLVMMAADQARYITGEEAKKQQKGKKSALSYFQSRLKE